MKSEEQEKESSVEKIDVTANGDRFSLPAGTSLTAFLEERGQHPDRVVVERNGEPLTPAEARTTVLRDGDRLEIVRIVAGG